MKCNVTTAGAGRLQRPLAGSTAPIDNLCSRGIERKKMMPDTFKSQITQIKDTEKQEGWVRGEEANEQFQLRLSYY